jgi:probable rRNA maturation factor
MIQVDIPETLPITLEPSLIEQAAQAALRAAGAPADADLTVVLAHDEQLQQLNLQFLGIDAPTDVLSFPAGEVDPDTTRPYLGDVIISVARAQAQSLTHPVEDELRLLVVHGVLHLLGHDHAEQVEKATMWALQRQALRSLGCEAVMPA